MSTSSLTKKTSDKLKETSSKNKALVFVNVDATSKVMRSEDHMDST